MAEFNPQISGGSPSTLIGLSQGTGTDRSFETLFSGLTEVAENAAVIQDTRIQNEIQDEARAGFEETNRSFGFDAPESPSGMQSDLERMRTLQNAVEQGKISQVNYYGRLATLSKQLRSRYPGYENIVDATIQSVTGTRPANAYRDALLSEMSDISAAATSEEKFQRQYLKENEGIIASLYGETFFQNPSAFSFDQIQADVALYKGRTENIDAEMKQLTLMSKRGEFNDKRASRAIDKDFSFVVESSLNSGLGLSTPGAFDRINQFITSGGGSPEELDQFIQSVTTLETELRTALSTRGRQHYSGILGADEINKAVENALYPIRQAKEAVLGGDFKLAARFATLNKSMTEQSANQILGSDPLFQTGAGLSEINKNLGEVFFTSRINQAETIALEVVGQAMLNREGVLKNMVESGNDSISRSGVDLSLRSLKDPKLEGESFSNLAKQLFSPGAIDFMSPKVVAAEDLERIYLQFTDPEITKGIFERGSPEDQRNYVEWATSKALAIPAFRSAAGNINTLAGSGPEGTAPKIVYNPDTNRLEARADNLGSRVRTAFGGTPYGRTMNAFNKVIQRLEPIYEAAGMNVDEEIKRMVENFNVEFEGSSKDSFWGLVSDAIDAGSDGEEVPGEALPETELGGTEELDFMFAAPEEATSLATDPNMLRAASGSYTGPLADFEGMTDPVEIAGTFDGLHEARDKSVIASFLRKAGGVNIDPAKTPWCAAFVNAVLGAQGRGGTGSLAARSFLNYGTPTQSPTRGDVVVFSRGKDPKSGHVGFYVREDDTHVYVMGGNQGNKVSTQKYPKSRLLGYRRPPKLG